MVRYQLAAIELLGAEPHDARVHAVLHCEHAGRLRLPLDALFKKGFAQAFTGCLFAFHRGRQLVVVARHHNALALGNGNPATRLQGLGGFVDEDGFKAQVANVAVAGTHQRAGDDLHRFEHLLGHEALQIVGGLAKRAHFFP